MSEHGNAPPPKPREWTGCKMGGIHVIDDGYMYVIVRVPLNGRKSYEIGLDKGTPVTLIEAREEAGAE